MSQSVSSEITGQNGLRTYRPPLEKYVFGSDDFKKRAHSWLEGVKDKSVSRALMLVGAPGLGKTTLAGALCEALQVHENDINQVNCASTRTLDDARDLIAQLNFCPTFGDYRVLILDEVHQMVPNAQQAFLTPIENLTDQTLLIGCTSAPETLNQAFRSRFYEIRIEPYSEEAIVEALENLPKPPDPKSMLTIARAANGNMRRAIDMVEGGIGPGDERTIQVQNAIEAFFGLLMFGKYRDLMYVMSQLTEGERKVFFDRNLQLLEGTWMTLSGGTTTLPSNLQRIVTTTIAKFSTQHNAKPNPQTVAYWYAELSGLQDKPFQSVKAWIMRLASQT